MRYLYLDNFRGFSRSFIPLKKVNFLVGENSTGKSSVLSVIQLLSSFRFWFDLSFNTELISLGTYDDIVSIAAKNKSCFRLGVIDAAERENFLILTFINEGESPFLSKVSYSVSDIIVNIKLSKNTVAVRRFERLAISIFDNMDSVLQEKGKGFKLLREVGRAARNLPLFILVQEANRFLKIEDKDFHIGQLFTRGPGDESVWLAPIRTRPERIYGPIHPDYSPEGEHTPHLIKDLQSKDATARKFDKFVKKFGFDSGLFESLIAKSYGEGSTKSVAFELDIGLFGKLLNIDSVGYGVSQSLPIVVECFAREKGSFFTIQQPEVHLHPKAQAALGDLFYTMALEKDQSFLVETHSDYIIDRFRLNIGKTNKRLPSQVLFFERSKSGNTLFPIEILEDGSLSPDQPQSYRDFFVKEELQLLDL